MPEPHLKKTGPQTVGGDGDLEIFCADEQTDIEVDISRWRELAEKVLRSQGVRGAAELTLMFVPETAIAGLNEQYMGKLGSTDVLAFPLDAVEVVRSPGPGAMSRGPERVPLDINDLPVMLGDVVVCPAVAMRQAPSHAGNLDDEFALLIVHGILHVLGLDHDTDEKAQTMQAAERKLLEQHHWGNAMPDSFRKVYES